MPASARFFLSLGFFAAAAGAVPVLAQSGSEPSARAGSWPGSGHGYLGLNLGRSQYRVGCGLATFGCDSADNAFHLYAGTRVGNFWGVEAGLLDMGRMARGGGRTRAQGLNLSLVGRAPLGASWSLFGKLGTTYGRTETSAVAGSGVAAGSETGFGLSYGGGLSYDLTPRLSATLGWDSHDFRFAGGGRDPVRATSLGLQYRY